MARKKRITTTTVTEEIIESDNRKLHAHVLIDSSGSMQSTRASTVNAINEYLSGLKRDNPDAMVSVSFFDSGYAGQLQLVRARTHELISNMRLISHDEYNPAGGTPLYDAIGRVVSDIGHTDRRVALVILTDGQENTSREYNQYSIKQLLDSKKEQYAWLVLYLGANQDAFAAAAKFGVSQAFAMNYTMNNLCDTMSSASASTVRYASADSAALGLVGANFTPDERKRAVKPESDKS